MNQSDATFPRLDDKPPQRPSPLPGVTWGLADIAIAIGGGAIAFLTLSAIIVGSTIAAFGDDSVEVSLAEAFTIVILDIVLVSTVLLVIKQKGAWLDALGFRRPQTSIGALLGYVALTYIAAIVIVNINGILIDVLGLSELEPAQQIPDDYYDHTSVVVVTGIAVVLMAPIAEEVFFRGFVFGALRRYMNMPLAGILSGSLFAMAHFDPGLLLPFAAIGFMLAYIYEWSRTLFVPIGVHFVFNGLTFAVLILFPELR